MRDVILTTLLSLLLFTNVCSASELVAVRSFNAVATAYTEAEDECGRPKSDPNYGRTASGEFVRKGMIAVDPKVIPMHSVVYVEGAGELSGVYEAKDTGGAIKGNRIDIYVPTKKQAFTFGRKNVKIYVLREGRYMPLRNFYPYIGFADAQLPKRQTSKAAGYDFFVAEDIDIQPKQFKLVHSGVGVKMLADDVLGLFARSSLIKQGLILANGVGVVDADYEGEIMFPLYNISDETVSLKKGDRVAQGVFFKYSTTGDVVDAVRTGGFGSTNAL